MKSYQTCAHRFAERFPAEAAAFLEPLAPEEVVTLLLTLPPKVAAALVQRLSPASAAACLAGMRGENAGPLMEELPQAVAASLLRQMAPRVRREALEHVGVARRQGLERSLRYEDGTAGAVADVTAPAFAGHLPAAEVRRLVRRESPSSIPFLFVIDDAHKLVGVLHARDLAAARGRTPLASIMQTDVISVPARAELSAIVGHAAWGDHDWLPVVERSGAFVGAIGHRHVRQHTGAHGQTSLVDALFHLGELYWQSVSMFMPATSPPGGGETKHDTNREGDDGAH